MKQLFTRLLLFSVCLLVSVPQSAIADTYPDDERLFKAAYIFNFARLTTWPDNTWSHQYKPFTLCTTGEDELVDDLNQLGGEDY